MRAELIGHFQPCMTDIYLHIDARVADYIRTHPYLLTSQTKPFGSTRKKAQTRVQLHAITSTNLQQLLSLSDIYLRLRSC